MLSLDQTNPATPVVLQKIRDHIHSIAEGIENFHADRSRYEELDDSLRRTRVAKCATSIIGQASLNRLLSLQEDLLETTATANDFDDDTCSLLITLIAAVDTFIEAQQSPQAVNVDCHQQIGDAIRAYRRHRGLPSAEDELAIQSLLTMTGTTSTPSSNAVTPTIAGDTQHFECEPTDEVPSELLDVFREEADEHLNQIYAGLSHLAESPDDREQLESVRRATHTFKGAAGAIGLLAVSRLAHQMEDVLDELFDGQLDLTAEDQKLLLDTTDILQDACQSGAASLEESIRLVSKRYAIRGSEPDSTAEEHRAPVDAQVDTSDSTPDPPKSQPSRSLRVPCERLDDMRNMVSELMINRASLDQKLSQFVRCIDDLQPVLDRMRSVSQQLETQYEVPALRSQLADLPGRGLDEKRPTNPEFDELEFDRYTELHLLTRSIAETTSDTGAISHELRKISGDIESLLAQQNRLMIDTQDRLFEVRMVEFGTITSRLERIVRQVADSQRKDIELTIEGADTELDKTVLEELVDPLLHLIRNSADHGIEHPNERSSQGKTSSGHIKVAASHVGTQVVIRIADDGQGIDAERLRNGIVQGGFLSESEAQALPDEQLFPYIFIPGFSTATHVSEISGRGVGMDIVRNNVSRLKGSIHVESTPGCGTTFSISLPTTLVVTRALIVSVGQETYAIPNHSLVKIKKLRDAQLTEEPEGSSVVVDGTKYSHRSLEECLGSIDAQAHTATNRTVAVVNLGEERLAISFDRILATQDVVVKELGDHLGSVQGLLGATVLGDGTVVPIIDVVQLVSSPSSISNLVPKVFDAPEDGVSVMIVDDSVSVRRALSNLIEFVNWTPILAKDGLDALERLADVQTPDVVLLDVEMPRMDGYELLAALRHRPEFQHTPIIMITSRAGDKHRQKAMELGATAYVVKPFQDDALLDLIRRHRETAKRRQRSSSQPAISTL